MRQYENIEYGDNKTILDSLRVLADKESAVSIYREAFLKLGEQLGLVLNKQINDIDSESTMLVCASEDADWLARGVEKGLGFSNMPMSVFWTARETVYEDNEGNKLEISPIINSYEEPIVHCRLLVIVKSIISSSCVVKTQLSRLIDHINPEKIAILAPVMYKDGKPNLMKEFPDSISSKFHFVTFAIDDEKQGSEVIPGVGGLVYPRLGLGNINEKNKYLPEIVLERL